MSNSNTKTAILTVATGKYFGFLNQLLSGIETNNISASEITVFVFTGLTGVDPTTANDFRKNFIVIIVCSIVFMIAWAALSLMMFAANPEQSTYYFFIMIAMMLGLSFMSVSVSVMNKLTGSN